MADISPTSTAKRPAPIDLAQAAAFRLGGLAIRPALREIDAAGVKENLEPRVMQALVALWEEHGQVVSRERLIERVWDSRIVSDDAINNCIAKLRRVGEAHGAFGIETVARVGYRLVGRQTPQPTVAGPSRWRLWVAGGVAIVALAMFGGWAAMRSRPAIGTVVAVEAFQAQSTDPVAVALAGRVRDQITAALAAQQIDAVAGEAPSRPALRVTGVAEARGAKAEVRVKLADTRTGGILWQAVFPGGSLLGGALPEQATARTVTAVTMAAEMLTASHGRIPPDALRAYIQGRDGYRERRNVIEQVAFMRTAAEGAPKVALAHAALALPLLDAAADQPPATRDAWVREGAAEARLAIRLDPSLGLAYPALAESLGFADYAGRQAALEEGLRRAPLDGAVQSYWSLFLAEVGRPMEGAPFARRGQTLDPYAAPRRFANVEYFAAVGDVDAARAQLAENRRVWPQNLRIPFYGSRFAVLAADPAEGRAMIRELDAAFPDAVVRPDLWLDFFDALETHRHIPETARAIHASALNGEAEPGLAFTALSRLGAVDQALDVAEHARTLGHLRDPNLLFARQTAAMRRDPRFMDLAARLGLAAYWRASGRWPEFCADPGLPYDCKAEAQRTLAGTERPAI